MGQAVAHRGPDASGEWANGPVGLVHRRLAILDLTNAGNQPMLTNDGRLVLVFNGEIYNHQALRDELEGFGYQFKSRTDTEVVMNAFSMWGEDCVTRLNGMFAFAIWDQLERSLFLARDRYGIKPLYWTLQNGHFFFGSEVKAILAHPYVDAKIDEAGLIEYFHFQNFISSRTLYDKISLFPAGHVGTLSLSGIPRFKLKEFWDFRFEEPEKDRSEQDYREELKFKFQESVRRQMMSDVPIGSYLSGGVDSGAIASVASRFDPGLSTFTIGFDTTGATDLELAFDERASARAMADALGTNHFERVLVAGDMERSLAKVAMAIEEPRVGQSYPNFYAALLAHQNVKVVFSGAGGDEIFAGYPWRYYRTTETQNFSQFADRYYGFWQRLIPDDQISSIFEPLSSTLKNFDARAEFASVLTKNATDLSRPEDFINASLYFEAKTFLNGLLIVEDKLSMANSIESRVPFLDNDLVDFGLRLPVKYKLRNISSVDRVNENEVLKSQRSFQRTNDGKMLLRGAMRDLLPSGVVERAKQGFSAPDATWFKGNSYKFVSNVIGDKRSPIYQFLDFKTVNFLVDEHMCGRKNRRLLIWSLLNFDIWCRIFLSGENVQRDTGPSEPLFTGV